MSDMTEPRFICATFSCVTCGDHYAMELSVPAAASVMYPAPPLHCGSQMYLIVAPLGVTVSEGWIDVKAGAGATPSVLDVIPIAHRDHGIKGWDRQMARRGWDVGCACGQVYEIDDSDTVSMRAVEKWLADATVEPRAGAVKWVPVADPSSARITTTGGGYYISGICPGYPYAAARETTKTSVADVANSEIMRRAAAGLGSANIYWSQSDRSWLAEGSSVDYFRLRSAMAAMSNAASCIYAAQIILDEDMVRMQRFGQTDKYGCNSERASAEWSRRVRAGVAALPKPGPVVTCQGDYEDE